MGGLLSFPAPGSIGYRTALLAGTDGTAQTVDVMRQLVDQAITNQQFVRFAIDIVRNVAAHDELAEVQQVYSWVLANIRFTKDPVAKEVLRPPAEMLKLRAGDCDDISTLMAALLLSLGYPARLVTIAADPSAPTEFSHVYVEAEVSPGSGQWLALDAARPGAQFGVEPPDYYRKRVWSLTDSSYQDISGYGRRRLGSYSRVRRQLGDDASETALISQALAQVPADIAIASGNSPYASFQTVNTPGYGISSAGYTNQGVSSSWLTANWPLVAVALLFFALHKR
jgi:Transglutaminase-like superfamily